MGDPNCIQSSIPSLFLIGPHSVDAGHNDKTVCVAGEMLEHRYGLRWVWERNEGAPGFEVLPIVRPRTPVWRPMGSPIGAVAHIGIGANARCFILVAPHAQIVDA